MNKKNVKRSFLPRKDFAWGTAGGFFLCALLWHTPLLFPLISKQEKEISKRGTAPQPYLIFQMTNNLTPSVSRVWTDPTVYLLPPEPDEALRFSSIFSKNTEMNSSPPDLFDVYVPERWEEETVLKSVFPLFQSSIEKNPVVDAGVISTQEMPMVGESAWWVSENILRQFSPHVNSPLPSVASLEPLEPSVLRVGITSEGNVQFVILEESSRSNKADELAIHFVKGIHFAPLDSSFEESVFWGAIKILWHINP